jgi:hypothetical protein
MSYLTDIGSYLIANGITDTIFYDELDDSYPECIAISDYQGANVYETVSGEEDPDYQNINIIVRKQDREACFNTSWTIYKLLKHKSNITIGSTYFLELWAKGPPAILGRTPAGYIQRTVNFSTKFY